MSKRFLVVLAVCLALAAAAPGRAASWEECLTVYPKGSDRPEMTVICGGHATSDTVVSRREPVFNVRGWGILPDDGKPDGRTLRSLVQRLPDGATVEFPRGDFLLDLDSDSRGIFVTGDSITLQGQGAATRLVVPDGEIPADGQRSRGHDGIIAADTGVSRLTIRNLVIDGNSEAPGNRGQLTAVRILPGSRNARIENVTVRDIPGRGRGITINAPQSADRTRGLVVDSARFRNIHKPIDAFSNDDLTVKNSTFIDVGQDAMELNDIDSFSVRWNYCRNVDLHCVETSGTMAPGSNNGIIAYNRDVGSNFERSIGNSASFDLKKSSGLTVVGNQVFDGAGIGIRIGRGTNESGGNTVKHNYVHGAAVGISVTGSNNQIVGNTTLRSDSEGIRINGGGGTVSNVANVVKGNHSRLDNQLGGNPSIGIYATRTVVRNNFVFNNPDTAIMVTADSNFILDNQLFNNATGDGAVAQIDVTGSAGNLISAREFVGPAEAVRGAEDDRAAGILSGDGLLEFDALEVRNGMLLEPRDLTTLDADPGEVRYFHHDGSGGAAEGLYRSNPSSGKYIRVEDNGVTIPY